MCFQQHISAYSVDKVSRNWLMDVIHTMHFAVFILTDVHGILGRFKFKSSRHTHERNVCHLQAASKLVLS